MNKREFIAELWGQVDTLCIQLKIKCSKCLDTKMRWTNIHEKDIPMLIGCSHCCQKMPTKKVVSDADFYGDMAEKRILLFEDRDESPGSRLEVLKELEKERAERELIRWTDLLLKRDRDFADGSTVETFGKNRAKQFSRTVRFNRLQTECNALFQTIVELHSFPWKKVHEIPVIFTWPELYTQGFSWDVLEDENAHPVYFFMVVQAQNYMNWLKIVDSCSLFSDEVHLQIKTYILYPKNARALETCDSIISDFYTNQHLLERFV